MRPAAPVPACVLSLYRSHLELMAEMQRMGYTYCNEDIGVFGIHRHGPGLAKRLTCLWMWSDCIANFDPEEIRKAGHDPADVFFRALAYRMMWVLYWHVASRELTYRYGGARHDEDRPQPDQLALFQAFNEVEPLMRERHILPSETGVVYRAGGKQVLWAFRDVLVKLGPGQKARDVLAGTVEKTRALTAQARRVYVLS